MPDPTIEVQDKVLYSWKEIAVFLRCGMRTAQRWERDEELPVHRHHHQRRGTVYALTSEIDVWLKSRDLRGDDLNRTQEKFGLGKFKKKAMAQAEDKLIDPSH